MSTIPALFTTAWLAVLTHLWQTTLVLGVVFLLSRLVRHSPARFQERLCWLGLAKLFAPLALGGAMARLATPLFGADGAGWNLGLPWSAEPVRGMLDPLVVLAGQGSRGSRTRGLLAVTAVVLWVAVAAWRVALLSRRWRASGPFQDDAAGPEPERLTRLRRALAGTGIPLNAICLTDGVELPQVRGLWRPRVILPRRHLTRLEIEELRAVLLHEDAHRRRRDPLRFLVLQVCMALLWFYPPVHWLHRRLRQAAEFACDEAVLRAGVDAGDYARALARTLRLGLAPVADPISAGIGEGSLLRRRFERLTEPWRYQSMKRHALLLILALLVVTAGSFLPLPDRVQAGDPATSVTSEFDTPPKLTRSVAPVYPEAEKKAGVEGMVLIKVEILASGKVGAVEAKQEVEGHPAFTESAMQAVRQFEFEPALKDGKALTVSVVIPIKYVLDAK